MEEQLIRPTEEMPWYDDRVAEILKNNEVPVDETEAEPSQYSPKQIYDYLDRHVWKQDEAKRSACVIMYNCLRGIRSTAAFVGPSGSGKTHVFRCLKKLFPSRIVICDGSNMTLSGWKGDKTWSSLLTSPIFRSGNHCILVLDEFDKMCSPKYSSGGDNVSQSIQSEGLTMMEGTGVEIKDGSYTYEIRSENISFVFCGAFSNKARDISEKSSSSRIGFGADPKPVQPYAKPLGESDLIEFGVMPEFMGRIQRIVNLQPMTEDDYYRMTDSSLGFLSHIGEQYKADIQLTPEKRRALAEQAFKTGLGVRGMVNQIRQLMDDELFFDCKRQHFVF